MSYRACLVGLCQALLASVCAACPPESELAKFVESSDIAIGELHGTEQVPALVRCIVDAKISQPGSQVVVSLDVPDPVEHSHAWTDDGSHPKDGRTSVSMRALVEHLLEQERKGMLEVRFDGRKKAIPQVFGESLKELAVDHDVVLYFGSLQTAVYPDDAEKDSIASYIGPSFTRFFIMALKGGEFWGCRMTCGPQVLEPVRSHRQLQAGEFVAGTRFGHDYIYFVEGDLFTASPPWVAK